MHKIISLSRIKNSKCGETIFCLARDAGNAYCSDAGACQADHCELDWNFLGWVVMKSAVRDIVNVNLIRGKGVICGVSLELKMNRSDRSKVSFALQ